MDIPSGAGVADDSAAPWYSSYLSCARTFGLPILLAIGAVAILYFWRVWGESFVDTDRSFTMGRWIEAVERLGIAPLYPPQENFRVGDVYLTLTLNPNVSLSAVEREKLAPLNYVSLKLGHADVSEAIRRIPEHPMIKRQVQDESFALAVSASDDIQVARVMFPTVVSRQAIDAQNTLGFGAYVNARRNDRVEIANAWTYGINPVDALTLLYEFCQKPEMAFYCTDLGARALLGYGIGSRFNTQQSSGENIFDVSILIVSQVYFTTSFNLSLALGSSADAQQRSDHMQPEATPEASVNTDAQNNRNEEARPDLRQRDFVGARFNSDSDLTAVYHQNSPLVFGYRAMSMRPYSNPVSENEKTPNN